MTRTLTPPAPVTLADFDAHVRVGQELGALGTR